jgi:hypothetical protein
VQRRRCAATRSHACGAAETRASDSRVAVRIAARSRFGTPELVCALRCIADGSFDDGNETISPRGSV